MGFRSVPLWWATPCCLRRRWSTPAVTRRPVLGSGTGTTAMPVGLPNPNDQGGVHSRPRGGVLANSVRLALLPALPDQRRWLILRGPSSLVRRLGSRGGVSVDRPELERCVVDVDLPVQSSVSEEGGQLLVDHFHPPPARAWVSR